MSRAANEFGDRVLGAHLVALEEEADGIVWLDFEHGGTDDDSGRMRVVLADVVWDSEARAGGDG